MEILGIILGFILVSIFLSKFGESSFDSKDEKLTTKQLIEQLEKNDTDKKQTDNKLLYLGLGALIGINLFD
ncbi:hypothetical protein [Sulfurimonas sp.]|uniref:hypothetical protein n=1 Tax=Sulfurimonas sp. TaxID=2022749 RepID=UPI002B4837AB|nr:hypothetical protein [Sulfurimonas sp.]